MSLPAARNSAFNSNAFLIFLSRFFPSVANLCVILWFSHRLTRDVYGAYTHFWIHLNLLVPVACFGLHVAMMTYSSVQITLFRRSVSGKMLAGYMGWVLVLAAGFTMLQTGFSGLQLLVPFLFFVSFTLVTILESLLIVYRRFAVVVATNLAYAMVFMALHYFYGRAGLMPVMLFLALLMALVARLAVFAIAIGRQTAAPSEQIEVHDVDRVKARALWLHLGVYDITQNLFTWIDKFIVSLFLTAGLSAMYYNGTVNIPFLPLLINAAGSAILLQSPAGREEEDGAHLAALLRHSGRVLSGIVFPLFAFLFFFRSDIFLFLFSAKYADAVPVFAVSLLVLPLRAYSFTSVLQRHHKGRLINIGSLADLALSCLLMYPMYRWLGLPGLALSFVVTTYLQAAYYLWVSAGVLQLPVLSLIPLRNWVVKIAVWSGLFFAARMWVRYQHYSSAMGIFAGGVLFAAAMGISFYIDNRRAKRIQG